MIKNTDVVTYQVIYKQDGELVRKSFKSFAAAAGCADALYNITRFLDVKAESSCGQSSISGSLYCYSKDDNSRRACNQYLIKLVTERKGL